MANWEHCVPKVNARLVADNSEPGQLHTKSLSLSQLPMLPQTNIRDSRVSHNSAYPRFHSSVTTSQEAFPIPSHSSGYQTIVESDTEDKYSPPNTPLLDSSQVSVASKASTGSSKRDTTKLEDSGAPKEHQSLKKRKSAKDESGDDESDDTYIGTILQSLDP
jgi:hypothetical protein